MSHPRPIELTVASAGALRVLRRGGHHPASRFLSTALDPVFKAKLVELVPGHTMPVVTITAAGIEAVDAWCSKYGVKEGDRVIDGERYEPGNPPPRVRRPVGPLLEPKVIVPCERLLGSKRSWTCTVECGRPTAGDKDADGKNICRQHAARDRIRARRSQAA